MMISDILPEQYFEEATTRDRGAKDLDGILKYLSRASYKISGLKDELPQLGFPRELREGLSHWINKMHGKATILDIAGGEAHVAGELADNHKVQVVTTDYYFPRKAPDKFISHDANQHLPFPNKTFDMEIGLYMIRYLTDPIATINELIRTSKKDGFILLNGVDRIYWEQKPTPLFNHYPLRDKDMVIYGNERWGAGDWALIQVKNPDFKFQASLDSELSFTVRSKGVHQYPTDQLGGYDIRRAAEFVYKKI